MANIFADKSVEELFGDLYNSTTENKGVKSTIVGVMRSMGIRSHEQIVQLDELNMRGTLMELLDERNVAVFDKNVFMKRVDEIIRKHKQKSIIPTEYSKQTAAALISNKLQKKFSNPAVLYAFQKDSVFNLELIKSINQKEVHLWCPLCFSVLKLSWRKDQYKLSLYFNSLISHITADHLDAATVPTGKSPFAKKQTVLKLSYGKRKLDQDSPVISQPALSAAELCLAEVVSDN